MTAPKPSGIPSIWRNQLSVTSSSSVDDGDVFHNMELTLKAAAYISPRMPGADAQVEK